VQGHRVARRAAAGRTTARADAAATATSDNPPSADIDTIADNISGDITA
jgi:hypothetical protein